MIHLPKAHAATIDELERLGAERDDANQVNRDVGEFLAGVAVALEARTIVEVGTSYGFSGLWWCAALARTGGTLHTIDVLEHKQAHALQAFDAAGVRSHVKSYLGNAQELLADADFLAGLGQGEQPIDVAFIDADKAPTHDYFLALWARLRVGGAIVTDNVLSHREQMGDYLERVKARDDAHSVTVPLRAGLEWTLKLK